MNSNLFYKVSLTLLILVIALVGCGKYNQDVSAPETTKEQNSDNSSNSNDNSNNESDTKSDKASALNKEVFNFATNQAIPHLDPHGTAANTSFRVTYMLYDRLVNYDRKSTEINPMLATKWDISEDGKTYIFYLREDATFSDGTPVTAEAVKYSFTRAIKVGKSAAGQFKKVIDENSFEIVNDHTIKITLKKPFGPFLKTLGTVYANIVNPKLADHAGDDLGQQYLSDKSMGSGPYVLESWDRGQKLVLKANENYWGGTPTMKQVNIVIIPEPSTARLMLEKGEIDLVDYTMISPDVLKQMEGKNDVVVHSEPGFQIDYMNMNMNNEYISNQNVRQAIAHSINYDVLLESIYLGNAIRINGAVPKGMFGYNPDAKQYDYDLDKAKRLLEEAGYADGFTLELAISENNEVRKNIAVILQSDLAKVGIDVQIKTYAWPTFLDLVTSGNHNLALVSWTPDYADPDYNLWYFAHSSSKGPGFNLSFYENSKVDQLLEEGRSIVDQDRREDVYKEIQAIMAEEEPYIFVAQVNVNAPAKSWVNGYEINPMNTWYVPFHKMTKE
jgi:peptide/nickel transport system substrate-binding protein